MSTSQKWVRNEVNNLLGTAAKVKPEGEGMDLTDQEYAMEDMAEIRSFISGMRSSIDLISAALARAWEEQYGEGKTYDDGGRTWKVGHTKGRRLVDEDMFYAWMASLDADQLRKLVSVHGIKVSGMTEGERQTMLDESPTNDKLSLNARENY
jgi:hypothetical protein